MFSFEHFGCHRCLYPVDPSGILPLFFSSFFIIFPFVNQKNTLLRCWFELPQQSASQPTAWRNLKSGRIWPWKTSSAQLLGQVKLAELAPFVWDWFCMFFFFFKCFLLIWFLWVCLAWGWFLGWVCCTGECFLFVGLVWSHACGLSLRVYIGMLGFFDCER